LNIISAGSVGGHVFDMYKQFTTNLDGVFNVEQSVMQRWRSASSRERGLPTNNGVKYKSCARLLSIILG
jgi:hypothetical protein